MTDGPVVAVLGFGPFLDVHDNPARRLALAVDGRQAGPLRIRGEAMPVSYQRSVDQALRLLLQPGLVGLLGVGVARGRCQAEVERVASNRVLGDDVDGACPHQIAAYGPEQLVSGDAPALADALAVSLSDDAGRYVCNGWLYGLLWRIQQRSGPAPRLAFLHIPAEGFPPDRLVAGLARAWAPVVGMA